MLKAEISNYLDTILRDFFPKEGNWKSNCFRREDFVSESNLPCHLRDIDWLASLIVKKYDLYSLGESVVKEYVRDSIYFNQLRSEYEQRIIRWQIHWMRNDGGNWIIDSKCGDDLYLFSAKCDYAFRQGIVDTLLAIGININAIEEGIEKNADMWRDAYMNLAFNNEFNPVLIRINDDLENRRNDEKLGEPDLEFKENWLKYRKYQYYQEHKMSIDQYSNPTPEMLITLEEAKRLELYLEKKSLERHQEIEEYKKRKNLEFELRQINQEAFYQLSDPDCISVKKEKKILKKLMERLRIN